MLQSIQPCLKKKTNTKKTKKQTGSSLEVHTQNVSAHSNISELNNCTTCEGSKKQKNNYQLK